MFQIFLWKRKDIAWNEIPYTPRHYRNAERKNMNDHKYGESILNYAVKFIKFNQKEGLIVQFYKIEKENLWYIIRTKCFIITTSSLENFSHSNG